MDPNPMRWRWYGKRGHLSPSEAEVVSPQAVKLLKIMGLNGIQLKNPSSVSEANDTLLTGAHLLIEDVLAAGVDDVKKPGLGGIERLRGRLNLACTAVRLVEKKRPLWGLHEIAEVLEDHKLYVTQLHEDCKITRLNELQERQQSDSRDESARSQLASTASEGEAELAGEGEGEAELSAEESQFWIKRKQLEHAARAIRFASEGTLQSEAEEASFSRFGTYYSNVRL